MISLVFLALVTVAQAPSSSLEIEGQPGVKVFGVCFSAEGKSVKFSETTPSEVDFDIRVEKCEVKKSDKEAPLKIRLYHDRQLAFDRDFTGPDAGIEFVIPLTKTKH